MAVGELAVLVQGMMTEAKPRQVALSGQVGSAVPGNFSGSGETGVMQGPRGCRIFW